MIVVGSHVRFHDVFVDRSTWIGRGVVTAIDDGMATIRLTFDEVNDEPCDDEYPEPVPVENCVEFTE